MFDDAELADGIAQARERRRLASLLDIRRIYLEPAVHAHPRGREILARFPDAELIEVASHWRIPDLFGNEGAARDWVRNKRTVLVLGVKKAMTIRPNGRSADYIAPGASNGCALACVYCYVPRRKGFANPITTFVNIGQICAAIERHALKLGPRREPGRPDPHRWVYDIGENGDASVDDLISGNVRDQIELFRRLPNAKGSFATKYVNRDLLAHDPRGGCASASACCRDLSRQAARRPQQSDGRAHPRGRGFRPGRLGGSPELQPGGGL